MIRNKIHFISQMACKSRNNSRGNFSKFNPLKFVKNIHKKPECASLDSKTKERSHGPTTKSQSLIKFQISTSLGINSKELHPTTSNVKGKWRPNFLKYLRSPKVCPLPKRRNSGVVIPLESTSTIVASAGRDTNEMCVDFAAKDLHILTGSLGTDALVNDSNADDKRSCVSKGKLANSTNLAPVDETSAPGSLSSGN